jgi:hypothetical protein
MASSRGGLSFTGARSAQNVTMAIRPGEARGDLTDACAGQWTALFPWLFTAALPGTLHEWDGGTVALDPRGDSQAALLGAIDNYFASPVAQIARSLL